MSKYADEGTIAHALAAMALTQGRPTSAYINRVIESEDYEHAALSPSTAHRWMLCPGSHALERRQKFVPRKFSMVVTPEMAEDVQKYVDKIVEYAEGNWLSIEQRIDLTEVLGVGEQSGTGDAVIVDPINKELQLHDLKFGKGVQVDADRNPQLMLYAAGKLVELAIVEDIQRVRLVIHQPRLNHLSEWDCSTEEMQRFVQHAKERAKHAIATLDEKPEALIHHLKSGEKQCRFCNVKATCPRLQSDVLADVFDGFEDLDAAEAKAVPDTLGKLARLYAKLPLIDAFSSAVGAAFEAKLLAGEKHPDYKLVTGKKGNRRWSDEKEAEQRIEKLGVPAEQMYVRSLASPTALEKVAKKTLQPEAWEQVSELITQSDGKPTVVPVSDRRSAITVVPVIDGFEDLSDEEQ